MRNIRTNFSSYPVNFLINSQSDITKAPTRQSYIAIYIVHRNRNSSNNKRQVAEKNTSYSSGVKLSRQQGCAAGG